MESRVITQRVRGFALACAIGILVVGGALPAAGGPRPTRLNVDLGTAAGLAPDGHSVSVNLLARCPERWTVLEAFVTVSQDQASGQTSFPLTCTGQYQSFFLTVQSASAAFHLGDAQADALVRVQRGGIEQTQDSQVVGVEPTVLADLADTALLGSGGQTARINVTVACPIGPIGEQSHVNISSQGQVSGNGFYVPVCDGEPHTFTVNVQASQGLFRPGSAQALTFAVVEHEGTGFYGIDQQTIQIVQS
jgi:hypothetical protein